MSGISVLRGSQPNQGGIVLEPEMVECPMCKGVGGCPICTDGMVKKTNLERARENSGWPDEALMRLWAMVVSPMRCRRERTRQQRAWLEQHDEPSRLDRADRDHPGDAHE